jgi:hypothetical protein
MRHTHEPDANASLANTIAVTSGGTSKNVRANASPAATS